LEKTYIAIDLKSFYASVECVDRGLDPLTTNLVVADNSRTEKTICLAVSPALKSFGVPGRPRLFEVVQKVREINAARRKDALYGIFTGSSCDLPSLSADCGLSVDYIVAKPRMARYLELSTEIYNIYCRHVSPDDIHVYSIDEVFIDATGYLRTYGITARELAMRMILDVLSSTGITATAGIGPNLYLCKVAMDIKAKHIPADSNGVRIAELTERSYRAELWNHRPITDFWRIGGGYAKKLADNGLYTMGDVARCSLGSSNEYYNEELLYRLFGINAELLIDHAWGYEPCTLSEIKAYKPENNSLSSGQVLHCPYDAKKARIIVREMIDLLCLDMVEKGITADQLTLTIGYDIENLKDPTRRRLYQGTITFDHYGRAVPKHAHGTANLGRHTSSCMLMTEALLSLYDRIINPYLLVRRITIGAHHVLPERMLPSSPVHEQLSFFVDQRELDRKRELEKAALAREKNMQRALITIRNKYGKNAILKGTNFQEGATARDRNAQIGGHKA